MRAYGWRRLVLNNCLDLLQYFWRELRDDINGLQIVQNLFGTGSAQNYSAGVWISGYPRQRQMCDFAVEF